MGSLVAFSGGCSCWGSGAGSWRGVRVVVVVSSVGDSDIFVGASYGLLGRSSVQSEVWVSMEERCQGSWER